MAPKGGRKIRAHFDRAESERRDAGGCLTEHPLLNSPLTKGGIQWGLYFFALSQKKDEKNPTIMTKLPKM